MLFDIVSCNFAVDFYFDRLLLHSELLMCHIQNILAFVAYVEISYWQLIIDACSLRRRHMNSDLAQIVLLLLKFQEPVAPMVHWAMASASSHEEQTKRRLCSCIGHPGAGATGIVAAKPTGKVHLKHHRCLHRQIHELVYGETHLSPEEIQARVSW